MINNKKGMSGIVVTLITVLLAIVAIGIVWAVVSGIISQSSSGAEYSSRCVNAGIEITSATAGADTIVGVKRLPGANGEIFDGITITVGSSNFDIEGNVLSTKTLTATSVDSVVGDLVEAQVYFNDADDPNVKHYCDQVATYEVLA